MHRHNVHVPLSPSELWSLKLGLWVGEEKGSQTIKTNDSSLPVTTIFHESGAERVPLHTTLQELQNGKIKPSVELAKMD